MNIIPLRGNSEADDDQKKYDDDRSITAKIRAVLTNYNETSTVEVTLPRLRFMERKLGDPCNCMFCKKKEWTDLYQDDE
ncbi:MAG TPA: hypothetical protein VEP90_05565 [Methylomirabilota bacterium]|nr:hypothetical protein [Methylomirabilota bacterium]